MKKKLRLYAVIIFCFTLVLLLFLVPFQSATFLTGMFTINLLISVILLVLSFFVEENTTSENKAADNKTDKNQFFIPDSYPHCKNPNSKRIRSCEWCGNQII